MRNKKGLHLHVSTTECRSWRHKYRSGGKEKLRTLGTYPEVTLKDARGLRDSDKRLLSEGKDLVIEAKRVALANRLASTDTFEALAREQYGNQTSRWKPVHAADVIESLERDIFGDLGSGLVDQSQKMTVAASAMAEKKTVGHRS